MRYEGQCLYGQVILKTEQPWYEITACHYKICQKCNSDQLMSFIIENDISTKNKSNVNHCRSSAWLKSISCNKYDIRLFSKMYKPRSHYVNTALFEQIHIGFQVTQFYIGCNYMYYKLIEKSHCLHNNISLILKNQFTHFLLDL